MSEATVQSMTFDDWFKYQNYPDLLAFLESEGFRKWSVELESRLQNLYKIRHGTYDEWSKNSLSFPEINQSSFTIDDGFLSITNSLSEHETALAGIEQGLRNLIPWRKGPYQINHVRIDTEWRSDYKWERLKEHISPLEHRFVLDVGCGNGYHCWRMHEAGAKMVLGIDPSWLFLAQFQAVKHFMGKTPVYLLPIGIEAMPNTSILGDFGAFDTVFSMGVFYHRRSPIDHLLQLKQLLKNGGELVLETLIVDGESGEVLLPEDRYAKMRNVWFLPTVKTLIAWMQRCGFQNVRMVDESMTTTQEQRKTDWLQSESLEDFLDPNDHSKTMEGYPAPKRAIFIANKAR